MINIEIIFSFLKSKLKFEIFSFFLEKTFQLKLFDQITWQKEQNLSKF
jgi:hypothetical protein